MTERPRDVPALQSQRHRVRFRDAHSRDKRMPVLLVAQHHPANRLLRVHADGVNDHLNRVHGERLLRAGPLHELRVPVAALDLADQVRVAIDQPREHRVLGQVDLHRRSVVIADRLDPVAADADHAIAEHLARDDVDQPPGSDAGEVVAHGSVSRNDGSAETSATSICAFCSRPE